MGSSHGRSQRGVSRVMTPNENHMTCVTGHLVRAAPLRYQFFGRRSLNSLVRRSNH